LISSKNLVDLRVPQNHILALEDIEKRSQKSRKALASKVNSLARQNSAKSQEIFHQSFLTLTHYGPHPIPPSSMIHTRSAKCFEATKRTPKIIFVTLSPSWGFSSGCKLIPKLC
jgi:hypothetical protein